MNERINNSPESKFQSPTPAHNVESGGDQGVDVGFEGIGNISEVVPEIRESAGEEVRSSGSSVKDQSTQKKQEPVTIAQIRAQLLEQMPNERVARRQIKKEIEAEIKYLQKRAMKMVRSPGKMNYFEMANMMKKVRELKGLLSSLVKASFESVKTLWLRFVHGIM